jgi:chemotaxis protein MotB
MTPTVLLAALAFSGPARARPGLKVDKAVADQLEREVAACALRLQQAEAAACAAAGGPPAHYKELMQAFGGTRVEVDRDGEAVVLTFPLDELFSADALTLRAEAQLLVDLLATALRLHPELHALLVGHTHDGALPRALTRAHPGPTALSAAYAIALAEALSSGFGVEAARLTAAGAGPHRPRVSNDTPEGRALNHRLVVVLGPAPPHR